MTKEKPNESEFQVCVEALVGCQTTAEALSWAEVIYNLGYLAGETDFSEYCINRLRET